MHEGNASLRELRTSLLKLLFFKPIPTDNLTKYKTKNKPNINIVET